MRSRIDFWSNSRIAAPPSSGAYGCGRASSQPATKRFQPRSATASRSSAVPVWRSPRTHQLVAASGSERLTPMPPRVISDQVWGWCQCTQPPPYSIS